MQKRNFTFTDLCTVFAVSLVLMGLCAPLFTASATQAKRAVCADVQHKIANVAFAYAEDYGDYSVPDTRIGWMRYLSNYDKTMTTSSYKCPEDNAKRKYTGKGRKNFRHTVIDKR